MLNEVRELLIEPLGIETIEALLTELSTPRLLIEPLGIETSMNTIMQ